MSLNPGTKIGSYEILGAIGAGGMGEVCRARDTRLDREVAIKILPAAFAKDPDRLARFHREAKVLAALNHPNIAQIYGVEESSEGPALEAAHEKGIVYGLVALIVKADDIGVAMARSPGALLRALGRGLVIGMPGFLKVLTLTGMLAMLWVGGGIIVHGLQVLGEPRPETWIDHAAASAGTWVPAAGGVVTWLVRAAVSAVLGLFIGALCAPLADRVLAPAAKWLWAGK